MLSFFLILLDTFFLVAVYCTRVVRFFLSFHALQIVLFLTLSWKKSLEGSLVPILRFSLNFFSLAFALLLVSSLGFEKHLLSPEVESRIGKRISVLLVRLNS